MNPRLVRGQILAVAWDANPKPVTDREIFFALDDGEFDVERKVLREHLRYLEEAGYVRTELDFQTSQGGEFSRVWLTGKGLQLLRGEREPDPLVDSRGYADAVRLKSPARRA